MSLQKRRKEGFVMKKTIFVLSLLLLAGSVMATGTVTITIVPEGSDLLTGAINYTADANVRAFGLNLVLTGSTMVDVNNYKTDGESVTGSKGYGIYLDQETGIDINDKGIVQIYGSPVASPNSPGASGSGIDTNKVVLGMGALYQDGNEPPLSGTLCKFRVAGSCTACITAETTYRGGVVMEDGNAPTTLNLPCGVSMGVECYDSGASDYATWVAVGKPDCWCYTRQCHADADNANEGFPKKFYVYTTDLQIMLAAWKQSTLTGNMICADFDHHDEGFPKKYRVYTSDLQILLANWKTDPDPNCPNINFTP
jgi:hypothetical protein